MMTIRYELADGETGEHTITGDEKWVFGRGSDDITPQVRVDDRRVSRSALVVRDSGPGPVLFRGQRGDDAVLRLLDADGSSVDIAEGMAGNLTATRHRAELLLGDERIIGLDVEFTERGSVVERQGPSEDSSADPQVPPTASGGSLRFGSGPFGDDPTP